MSPAWPWSPPPETKTCRYCFQTIPGAAEVCPSCGGTVVRVRPAMARTLLIVFGLGFLAMIGLGLWEYFGPDSGRDQAGEYARGLALGHEAGVRQGRQDAALGRPPDPALSAGLETFLRDRSPDFREGFKTGFTSGYYQAYPKKSGGSAP
ncbi:MAG: hypothetical protein AB1896_06645 [Thermodesulfobacteriota bacterium]